MIAFAINVLEYMWTQFSLLSFKMKRVSFKVGFAAPTKVMVVFGFMGFIAFNLSRLLEIAYKCSIAPLPTVFALWDAGVHVSSS